MKHIKYLALLFIAAVLTACGGSCNTNTNSPIITALPNSGGAVVTIPVSKLYIPEGSLTASTSVNLAGGTPGLLIGLSSTVTATPATVKNSPTIIPISVSFNPESLVAGSVIKSDVAVNVYSQLTPGKYYINIYATYLVNGSDQTILLGVMIINVGTSGPTGGAVLTANPSSIALSSESASQSVTITNTGTANATNITLPTLSAPITMIATTCSSSLAPQESCSYTVAIDYYQSQVAGNQVITFEYNNGSTADTLPIAANWTAFTVNPFAYIGTWWGSSLLKCAVDPTTGALGNCNGVNLGNTMQAAAYALINGNTVYISDNGAYATGSDGASNAILICSLNRTTGDLSNCAYSTETLFSSPAMSAINNNYFYVINYYSTYFDPAPSIAVTVCKVDSSTGLLSNCMDSGFPSNPQVYTSPTGITINNNYAYIGQYTNIITKCTINLQTGLFSNCVDSGATELSNAEGITIKGGIAYIANGANNPNYDNGSIVVCSVSDTDGSLSNCTTPSLSLVTNPQDVVVNNNTLYITNNNSSSTLITCPLNNSGQVNTDECNNMQEGFTNPLGISMY